MDLNNLFDPLNINVLNEVIGALEEAEVQVDEAPVFGANNLHLDVDPFEQYSDIQFVKVYRLSKQLARDLIESLTPLMVPPRADYALNIATLVSVAILITALGNKNGFSFLKFFGSGSYQAVIRSCIYSQISQPSVSRSIAEVSDALNHEVIFSRHVVFPRNLDELNAIKQRFFFKYAFPNIIGCIDCTHVAIIRPSENEEVYVNRKLYHSINVQLICNDNLEILNVNARYPGSVHDSRIWQESNIYQAIERLHRQHPNMYCLLGDSAIH